MTDNLPSTAGTKPLWKQQRHFRVIRTKKGVKKILVNPDIFKHKARSHTAVVPQMKKPQVAEKQWDEVIKRDSGMLDKVFRTRRKIEEEGIELDEGEIVAVKIKIKFNSGMSVMGEVTYQGLDGEWQTVPAEFRQSKSSYIEWLRDCAEAGTPVIFKIDSESGLFPHLDWYSLRPLENKPMKRMNPPEEGGESMQSMMRRADGKVTVNELQGRTVREITLPDMDTAQQLRRLSHYAGRDIFGKLLTTQTRIMDYVKGVKGNQFRDLIHEYAKAVRAGKDRFKFHGREFMVSYAKHLIQHLANKEVSPDTVLNIGSLDKGQA